MVQMNSQALCYVGHETAYWTAMPRKENDKLQSINDIKSGTMKGIEILQYREHTVLVITMVKIWEFSAFNEISS